MRKKKTYKRRTRVVWARFGPRYLPPLSSVVYFIVFNVQML